LLLLARLIFLDLEDPAPDAQTFVFLGHSQKTTIDERLLMDAVAIYTRDLGIALVQSPDRQPVQLTAPAIDDLVALLRTRGARLGFWCQATPNGHQVELVTIDARKNVGHAFFDLDLSSKSDVYRAIALKLRAALVGNEGAEPSAGQTASAPLAMAPATAPAPVSAPVGPKAAVASPSASGPARSRASDSAAVAGNGPPRGEAQAASPLASRIFFGGGYALSFPIDAAGGPSARNGLALHVIAPVGPSFEWDLGTDLASTADTTKGGATVSVLDIPLRVEGRLLRNLGIISMGAGVFAGVHWLSADASATGVTDHESALMATTGLELLARGPSYHHLAVELRGWIEVNVPETRFTVQGAPVFDAGPLRLGLNLGIVAPVP
jgi:hypothetical protein